MHAAIGFASAAASCVFFGSFGVPIKSPAVQAARVDPVIYQCYKSFVCCLSGCLVLLWVPLKFTWWGCAGASLWVLNGVLAIRAIQLAGIGISQALWSGLSILVAFCWGRLWFHEPVGNVLMAWLGLLVMLIGMAGMTLATAGLADGRAGRSRRPLGDAPSLLLEPGVSDEVACPLEAGWAAAFCTGPNAAAAAKPDLPRLRLPPRSDSAMVEEDVERPQPHEQHPADASALEADGLDDAAWSLPVHMPVSGSRQSDGSSCPSSPAASELLVSIGSAISPLCSPVSGSGAADSAFALPLSPPPSPPQPASSRSSSGSGSGSGAVDCWWARTPSLHHRSSGETAGAKKPLPSSCFDCYDAAPGLDDGKAAGMRKAADALSPRQQVRRGVALAAVVGVLNGSFMVPLKYATHVTGLEYLPSFGAGSALITAAVLAAYCATCHLTNRVAAAPALLTGALWSLGNVCSILAVQHLGVAVGWPLVQAQLLVSSMWGICLYQEVRSPAATACFLSGAAVLVLGIAMLARYGIA